MKTMERSLDSTRQALESSVALAAKQLGLTQGMVDPSLEINIGDVFKPGSSNHITIKNTGPQSVQDLAVDLRCFAFKDQYDKTPILLSLGLSTADEKHHWWYIPELRPGAPIEKDASSALDNFLSNAEKMLAAELRPAPNVDGLNHPLPLISRELLVVDFGYHRVVDNKKYAESRTAWPEKDSKTGKTFLDTNTPVSTELQVFISRTP